VASNGKLEFSEALQDRLGSLKAEISEAQARVREWSSVIAQKQVQVEHILDLLRAEGVSIDRTDLFGVLPVSLSEVASKVLRQHGSPLHYKELTRRVEATGFKIQGLNPEATLLALLHRTGDQFSRTGRGIWALKEWNVGIEASPRKSRRRGKNPKRNSRA
jgi:hypothetical protein